jgi:hypothetical protein
MAKRFKNKIIIPDDPPKGPPLYIDILLLFIAPPFSTLAGLYFLIKRGWYEFSRRKNNDYRHYAAIIGDRSSVSIRELATRLGKTPEEVAADLQNMINQDMIDARAYVDRNTMILHLDDVVETSFVNETVNVYTQAQSPSRPAQNAGPAPQTEAKTARPAPEPQPRPEPRTRPRPRPSGMENEDFEAKLREIRQLNDEIDNEVVSQRIDRIGELTASIFRVVREKPERADEVRKFMNYYLPTTLKLLRAYSLMEQQSYQGENIQNSRKKIEDVLDTLVRGFEQQQDRLFRTEAIDVEADIKVLETMMASDGLVEPQGGLRTSGGRG